MDDFDFLMEKFAHMGLSIIQEIQTYDYGKFAKFVDPFDNIIELWEPNVIEYKKMVNKEIESYKKLNK